MASPTRDCRLRIPRYTVIPEGLLGGSSTKDLIFSLKARRIQKDIADGGQIINLYGRNAIPLSFSIIRFVITVDGSIVEDGTHSDHPVTTAEEHVPDWVDMEEAAVLWNNAATPDGNPNLTPQLEIEHGIDGAFRVYKGLIRELELVRYGGKSQVDFKLLFEVAWSTSNPTLREWA